MFYVVEMQQGGVFEPETKRKGVAQIIQHFAERDEEAGQIKAIYIVKKNDKTDEFCRDIVSKIQDMIDEGVVEWRKTADEEHRGQKEIESDYWAGVL